MGRFLDFISGKSVPNEVAPEPQVEETVEISEPIEEKKTNFFNLNSGKKKRKRK